MLADPEIGPHGCNRETIESGEGKGRGVVPSAFRVRVRSLKGKAVEVSVAAFVLPDGDLNRAFSELLNGLFRHGLSSLCLLTKWLSHEQGRGTPGNEEDKGAGGWPHCAEAE